MISLKPINNDNLFEVIKLSKTLDIDQQKRVADNIVSIAQAYVHYDTAWPRAIYEGETLVGLVMLNLKDEDIPKEDQPAYFLWRFMIAKPYQNLGYGKKVIEILIQKSIAEGQRYLYVSCEMDDKMPYAFYIKMGFIDTHEVFDGEEVLKLKLDELKPHQT